MIAVFHDMMGKEVEDYVNDLVIKSVTREGHWDVLRRVFERCKMYNLKMNPSKCVFGVSSGKFLGFYVHQRGINVDPEKIQAIIASYTPKTHKKLKSLLGKLSYIRRFIPGLSSLITGFTPLMKKGAKFTWTKDHDKAYEKIQ